MISDLDQSVPRVAFDARLSIGSYRGMGRFARQMVRGYKRQFLAFAASGESDPDFDLCCAGPKAFPIWEQLSLPWLAAKHHIDYLFCPYNTAPLHMASSVGLILAIHDLIYMIPVPDLGLSKSAYQNVGRLYRRLIVPRAIRRARFIITVSQSARLDLLKFHPPAETRTIVIPNTIRSSWFIDQKCAEIMRDSYVLCPSGCAPSKNLISAIQAFASFVKSNGRREMRMIVTGVPATHHASFGAIANTLNVNEQVQFLDYVSEETLQSLYREASICFVPSLYEGFGIPALEAMASGAPLVLSAIPAFQEVAAQAALYANPRSIEDMADKLRTAANKTVAINLRSMGFARAPTFHPARIGEKIGSFWRQVLCAS